MRMSLGAGILSIVMAASSAGLSAETSALIPGKFGRAVNLGTWGADHRQVSVSIPGVIKERPAVFECWFKPHVFWKHNIIMSVAPKTGKHWEIYTAPTSGLISVFIPGVGDFPSKIALQEWHWHYLALRIHEKGFELYVDGKKALDQSVPHELSFDDEPLLIGAVQSDDQLRCNGAIDDLVISRRTDALEGVVPDAPAQATPNTLAIFHFDEVTGEDGRTPNALSVDSPIKAHIIDETMIPVGDRFLDEVEEEARNQSTLHGDTAVEAEGNLPLRRVVAEPAEAQIDALKSPVISLNGEWLMKGGKASEPVPFESAQMDNVEGEGITGGWFREGVDRSSWLRVQVPTSVQKALVKAGELANPFYDANTYDELNEHGEPKSLPWYFRKTRIERNEWWFAREFELPADWQGTRIRLAFDGIDYAGSVFLNGSLLGYHAGMFGGPEYDISKAVRAGQSNTLVVRLDRAPALWRGVLKGSPGWGWHYGHLISLGIWRGVKLEQVPEVEITDLFVRTQSIADDKAVLLVQYDIINSAIDAKDIKVSGSIAGKNFEGPAVGFANRVSPPNGRSRWQTEITIANPKLWWPLNYGEQNLHQIQLKASGANGAAVSSADSVFGIRTIEKRPLRGAKPERDYRWQFVINNVPMVIKGANWCWSDPMVECDPAKYEHLLELARRGGIQMFRAWGGGIIETDEFYRLCDEKGIMVYQEFPFCWGPPTFPMTNPVVTDQQVSRVVKRLRNHPSLVMWGGGNENAHVIGADEGLFLVGRRCRLLDPSRPFHRSSPWGGSMHNWYVYHGGGPIDAGFMSNSMPFFGEFGVPSMTSMQEWPKFLPIDKAAVWPPKQDDGGLIGHIHQYGYGDLAKVMRYADYGPITNWKDYIEYSQMAQGDAIAFATNMQRAGSYRNKGGLWFYKFTELFPGHSWGVVGFYGQPKLGYYRAKQFFAPQAAFAQAEKYDWEPGEIFRASLHVNNDTNKPLENAVARAVIYGSDLSELWSSESKVPGLAASSRVQLDWIETKLPAEKTKPFLLAVSLRDADGRLISDQWQWFNFRAKTDAVHEVEKIAAWGWPHERAPEAFKAYGELPEARLLNLPKTKLSASLQRDGKQGTITIRNESALPAFNVIIDGFPVNYGNFLSDNSFGLYPNEERVIRFDLATADEPLEGLQVRAWNAEAVSPKTRTP